MIETALRFLPTLSYVVIGAVWLITEIASYRSRQRPQYDGPYTNGFKPPAGDGYEYYVSPDQTVYIHTRSPKEFRIYLLKGEAPIRTKKDRYGRYFTVNADERRVEGVVEEVFA